jgi:CHAT domain-containing protein
VTVTALADAPVHPGAQAILSACDSGIMNSALPDEALGPATSLLHGHFGSVTAALWALDDRHVPTFSESYHHHLTTTSPAEALAATQRELHDQPPHVWAAFVHHLP